MRDQAVLRPALEPGAPAVTFERLLNTEEAVAACHRIPVEVQADEIARVSSYTLKHVIEKALGPYISNGAWIQAALNIGLTVEPMRHCYNLLVAYLQGGGDGEFEFFNSHPPNAWIGISRASIRRAAA